MVATQIFLIFTTNPWGNDPIWRAYISNGWFNHQLDYCCRVITLDIQGHRNWGSVWLDPKNMPSKHRCCSRWWFQIFIVFTPTWGRFPFWLIFFKGVETTNQPVLLLVASCCCFLSSSSCQVNWWMHQFGCRGQKLDTTTRPVKPTWLDRKSLYFLYNRRI